LLANNVKDAIWLMDMELKFLWLSPSSEKLRGYTVEEMKAMPLDKHLTPGSLQRAMDLFAKAMDDERQGNLLPNRSYVAEIEYFRKDGSTFWAETTMTFMRNEKGKATSMLFEGWDITDRKLAEQAVARSEAKYRSLVETAGAGIGSIDLEGKLIFANARACRWLGLTEAAILGQPFADFLHPDDLPGLMGMFLNAVGGEGTNPAIEFRIVSKDGQITWLNTIPTPIILDGKMVGFNTILQDITERKEKEKEIEKQRKEYRTIFDSVRPGIAYFGKDGRIRRINKPWAAFFNMEPKEVLGKTPYDFYPPAIADQFTEENNEIINSGIPKIGIIREYSRPSKGKRWIQLDRIPYVDADGNIVGIISFNQDITQRKLAEEKLAEASRQLEATNEELRSAIANKDALLKEVHHRVKNNLMVISSLLNLQMKRTGDEVAYETLRESDSRIMSMATIHELVLQSGEYASIDCVSYISNLVPNIRNSLGPYKKDVRLTVDIQPGIAIDMNQAVYLGLIINELVSNSFKHAFTGVEKCEITISCRGSEDQVQLSIRDSGIGIPDEVDIDLPSSLGLQLVTILVKQLKGTIKYERDKGSKFTIAFRTKAGSTKEGKEYAR
jgi:PAS domain S-box-containing protein